MSGTYCTDGSLCMIGCSENARKCEQKAVSGGRKMSHVPSVEDLRDWANDPAGNGMVPIYPATLHNVASELERLQAELREARKNYQLMVDHAGGITKENNDGTEVKEYSTYEIIAVLVIACDTIAELSRNNERLQAELQAKSGKLVQLKELSIKKLAMNEKAVAWDELDYNDVCLEWDTLVRDLRGEKV